MKNALIWIAAIILPFGFVALGLAIATGYVAAPKGFAPRLAH